MMATAVGPEPFVRSSPGAAFDNNPDHLAASMASLVDPPSFRPQHSPRADVPPNPPFVFPAQPSSPSTTSGFPRTTGRRPMSAIESPNRSFDLSTDDFDKSSRAALPAFSFNPGASLPAESTMSFLLSPPMSPATPRNMPSGSRPTGHGHRRGGSEFVGGRIREGNSISVMSTSPTKSESGFDNSSLQPPRRRHRRGISGTISTNDLPILQAPAFDSAFSRGSSAPNSPTAFGQPQEKPIDAYLDTPSQKEPEPTIKPEEPEEVPKVVPQSTLEDSPKQKSGPRARVGFSDTLEFIPRPLSLVSNETSSTVTARPGHAFSGSISSIISAASPSGRSSPTPVEGVTLSRTSTRDPADSRPSTAGAILERTQEPSAVNSSPRRRNSIPTLIHLAEASMMEQPEPSPTKTPKRWSFFNREPSALSPSPAKVRPHSSSSSESTAKASVSEHGSESANESPASAPTKSKKSGKKHKKKKVKGWAGAILPKKPKSKKSKSDVARPPTPPAPETAQVEEDDVLMDEPELMEDPELLESSTPTVTVTESPDLPKTDTKSRSDEEISYPMIDLDAALGPFNTPLPLNPEWEAAQRAAGNINGKRRLHSAQGMKGFSGPGMHYHRRAESAPDLPPFDPGRAGIHRFNSNSTMADVFEEDEEDDIANKKKQDDTKSENDVDSDSDATPSGAVVKDPLLDIQDKLSTHSSAQSVKRTSSSLSDKEQPAAASVRAERSRSSLHDSVIIEEMPSVIFRTPNMLFDRTDTTESNSSSLRRFSGNNELSPVEIGPVHIPSPANMPNSPYAISHASSFPSPRSPMSVEVQRISTTPSSITDENNFQSLLLMGEPGPEVRISMDYDIPSLTSSNSTMTRDSMFIPGQRMSQPTMRDLRPVSVSSAAFGRRRSSLASLSRLISSSHGERSKLSMEVTMDEPVSKKAKNSRTKRLGRMMQFWKPSKENTPK